MLVFNYIVDLVIELVGNEMTVPDNRIDCGQSFVLIFLKKLIFLEVEASTEHITINWFFRIALIL